jgi:hypothetical protein
LFFPEKALKAQIAYFLADLDIDESLAGDVLNEIESHHGIIVKRSENFYSYSHLTYQEYFVARHLVENGDFVKLTGEIGNARWREIIVLIAASLTDCSDFILGLLSNVNHSKLKTLASRGTLSSEYHVLRSLVLSELRMVRSVRKQLYDAFLQHHERAYSIPWQSLTLDWRFSPKANSIMVKFGFGRLLRESLRVTNAVAGFRNTLELVAFSESFIRYFAHASRPAEETAGANFDQFVALCSDVNRRGVGYRLKMVDTMFA